MNEWMEISENFQILKIIILPKINYLNISREFTKMSMYKKVRKTVN